MAEKQQQDQNHHISVLKEQVKARENKVAMLTADVSYHCYIGITLVDHEEHLATSPAWRQGYSCRK